jgi:hypothetical protein
MPYKLCFEHEDGDYGEIKPLANNNPTSEHGFEDRRIFQRVSRYAASLEKTIEGVEKCWVEHYDDE